MEGELGINESPTINSVLKPSKARIPLKEIVVCNNDEESTATRKRRVSFANVNKIKEFSSGAESLVVCHTPAYEEPFSISSDSSYPGANGSMVAKHVSATNLKDSTLTKINDQSSITGPSRLPVESEYICRSFYDGKEMTLTEGSPDTSSGSDKLDLTEAASSSIFISNIYSRKSLQGTTDLTRYSVSGMDLTKGLVSHCSSKIHQGSVDNTKFSESDLEFTKPVVSNNISRALGIPYENVRYSLNGMDLTNAVIQNYSSFSSTSHDISKNTIITNDIEKFECSGLEFTDVCEPKVVDFSTMHPINDRDFTTDLIKNDVTRYSSNMDCTDIINDEEFSSLSETNMDFTKPIHNIYNLTNNATHVGKDGSDMDDSELNGFCLTSKPLVIGSNMQVDEAHAQDQNFSVFDSPSIAIDTCTNSSHFSISNNSQNINCNEDLRLDKEDVNIQSNVSIVEKVTESLVSDNVNKCNNDSKKDSTNIFSLETKTDSLESSIKVRIGFEKSMFTNLADSTEAFINIDGNKNMENKTLTMEIENISENEDCKLNSVENVSVFKNNKQEPSNTTKTLSNKFDITVENSVKDTEHLKMDSLIGNMSSENKPTINSNKPLIAVDDKIINNLLIGNEEKTNKSILSSSTNIIGLSVGYQEIQRSETENLLNIEIQQNESIIDIINKTVSVTLEHDNFAVSSEASMQRSILLLSDDGDLTDQIKKESNFPSHDIEDTSILESMPLLQRMKSNQDKFIINEADSKCLDSLDYSLDGCEFSAGRNKGGKRSFEVALESDNDTEESPIKVMCLTKSIENTGCELLSNVSAPSFLAKNIPMETTQNLVSPIVNVNTNAQKIYNPEIDKKKADDNICDKSSPNVSLNVLQDDIYSGLQKSLLCHPSKDNKVLGLCGQTLNKVEGETIENYIAPLTKLCDVEIKDVTQVIGTHCGSGSVIKSYKGLYVCDLIPNWIKFQYGLNSDGFIIRSCFKIICSERDRIIGEYLLKQIKSAAFPDHVSELIQHLNDPRYKYLCELACNLSVICKYHNGSLDDNMLIVEMSSCAKKFWLYVSINIKYPQMLSATDINIHENKIGNLKLSLIRQTFLSIQKSCGQLLNFTEALMNFQYD